MPKKTETYLIGIDEVGRGPIAGPVAVGAFIFLTCQADGLFEGVKESKQLSEDQREAWFQKIRAAKSEGHIDFYVSFRRNTTIDSKGISFSIRSALKNSLKKLGRLPEQSIVLLDGGLKAPKEYCYQKTIIKGDEKEKVIACASICAKVLRDRRMRRLAKRFPEYGFDKHKGYGTREHYKALKKSGPMGFHRMSFLKKVSFFR